MSGWLTPFDGSGIEWHENLPNPYTYQESDFSKLVAAVHEYEAALREARAEADDWKAACEESQASEGDLMAEIARLCEALGESDRILGAMCRDDSFFATLASEALRMRIRAAHRVNQATLAVSPPADEAKR